jgi:copper chaperone
MITETFAVKGMTCNHCVQAVTDEVGAIDGVRSVQVDLGSGSVTVETDAPVSAERYAAAVDAAGYEVVR